MLLHIDVQPTTFARADTLVLRVWNHERELVFETEEAIDTLPALPLTLPLYPLADGDRSYVVEVAALVGERRLVVGRVEGTYVRGQRAWALLCLEDACHDEACGDESCLATPGSCTSCRGPEVGCESADPTLVVEGTLLRCPPPTCTPTEDVETECDDGIDADCDGSTDCEDDDCSGRPCGTRGRMCAEGSCECPTLEICNNGVSDDCDDDVDCADEDCFGVVCNAAMGLRCDSDTGTCAACDNAVEDCDNGVDDDCDGFADCQDPDCCVPGTGCQGQFCRNSTNQMCCDGSCARIDVATNCGRCRGECPERSDGDPRLCRRLDDPLLTIPAYLCQCYPSSGCRGGLECLERGGVFRCNCTDDDDCGAGLKCVHTGTSRHNVCRPI